MELFFKRSTVSVFFFPPIFFAQGHRFPGAHLGRGGVWCCRPRRPPAGTRYTIVRRMDSGAFGTVFEGRDIFDNVPRAGHTAPTGPPPQTAVAQRFGATCAGGWQTCSVLKTLRSNRMASLCGTPGKFFPPFSSCTLHRARMHLVLFCRETSPYGVILVFIDEFLALEMPPKMCVLRSQRVIIDFSISLVDNCPPLPICCPRHCYSPLCWPVCGVSVFFKRKKAYQGSELFKKMNSNVIPSESTNSHSMSGLIYVSQTSNDGIHASPKKCTDA